MTGKPAKPEPAAGRGIVLKPDDFPDFAACHADEPARAPVRGEILAVLLRNDPLDQDFVTVNHERPGTRGMPVTGAETNWDVELRSQNTED
jgi:hypothetical protein